MRIILFIYIVSLVVFCVGCGGGGSRIPSTASTIIVNSLEDGSTVKASTMTLRAALAAAASGQPITFDQSLDGGVINLSVVDDYHTELKGEVMGMRFEPSGPVSYLVGYLARDYGSSGLYARKDVVIDASSLPNGITIKWNGAEDARVMAIYGNLTMKNIAITGGKSVAVDISATNPDQLWTLGRGGGLAVWGTANLENCTIYGNSCQGDFGRSRDRGAFGGGLYADIALIKRCVISGNTVIGAGAAGGGVYSVGGADSSATYSSVAECAISGNKISGVYCYGAGVYSDGGGIGNRKTLLLTNCTIARNLVEPSPFTPADTLGRGYWRGSAAYASNGSVMIKACTIVENETHGVPRLDSLDRPNLAGAVAATVGNAHAVEEMSIGHTILAGNLVREMNTSYAVTNTYNQDVFTGSLMYFKSQGYNLFDVLQFSHILVPVGQLGWKSLCRRHYPKTGDVDGVTLSTVVDLAGGPRTIAPILSQGVDAGSPAVLSYAPIGNAVDQIPVTPYEVTETKAEYFLAYDGNNDFLSIVLGRIAGTYAPVDFQTTFTTDFNNFLTSVDLEPETPGNQLYQDPDGNDIDTLAKALWFGPAVTWPKELHNYPYIEFWHRLDAALKVSGIGLGQELLGDTQWAAMFRTGHLTENNDIMMTVETDRYLVAIEDLDQLDNLRPNNSLGDIGAIENQ